MTTRPPTEAAYMQAPAHHGRGSPSTTGETEF
jgi:hypothetical protein